MKSDFVKYNEITLLSLILFYYDYSGNLLSDSRLKLKELWKLIPNALAIATFAKTDITGSIPSPNP